MRFKAVPPTPPTEEISGESSNRIDGGNDDQPDDADATTPILTVRDALPLVPRSEGDCCARLVDRIDWIDDRAVATEWIVFLRALGLAERSETGYARVRGDIDARGRNEDRGRPRANDDLVDRFRENVVGVDGTIDALDAPGESPESAPALRSAEDVFEAIQDAVPEWERRRNDSWREEWLERTERILAWATAFGTVEQVDGGYRRT